MIADCNKKSADEAERYEKKRESGHTTHFTSNEGPARSS